MALTKEDLQVLEQLLDSRLEVMLDKILDKKLDEKIDEKLKPIQDDLTQLKHTVAKIEVEHGRKIDALYDAHQDNQRNAEKLRQCEVKLEDHGHRIFTLEQAAKK